jgi:hypothetical protein
MAVNEALVVVDHQADRRQGIRDAAVPVHGDDDVVSINVDPLRSVPDRDIKLSGDGSDG